MSYAQERDQFVARMSVEGCPLTVTRALLRYATTLQRLAEAQCNGDYPADNGTRITGVCPECEGGWAPAAFKRPPNCARKVCPDCYTQAKVRGIVPAKWRAVFGGDPRGAVLVLVPRETPEADVDSGRERGIYVPARS